MSDRQLIPVRSRALQFSTYSREQFATIILWRGAGLRVQQELSSAGESRAHRSAVLWRSVSIPSLDLVSCFFVVHELIIR